MNYVYQACLGIVVGILVVLFILAVSKICDCFLLNYRSWKEKRRIKLFRIRFIHSRKMLEKGDNENFNIVFDTKNIAERFIKAKTPELAVIKLYKVKGNHYGFPLLISIEQID